MMFPTDCGTPMNSAELENYLSSLVGFFYKILPLKECDEPTLGLYMRSLQRELIGCRSLINALHSDSMFTSLVSILQYLIKHEDSPTNVYKTEVFKAISICNKLKKKYISDPTEGGD